MSEAPEVVARVEGEPVSELPTDLYIPPNALQVFLDTFEGPLDLLLYLIRRQNLDILSIQVAEITEQYMRYIDLMKALELELAGEYLVMAAMLAEIKSRLLLPKPASEDGEDEDPRAELIRRLQEYEQIKSAAEGLSELPRLERDISVAAAEKPELVRERVEPDVNLKELLVVLAQVLRRAEMFEHHAVQLEPLSVRERMTQILGKVNATAEFQPFGALFDVAEGRRGVVVTFMAVLELIRERLLDFAQHDPFAPIYVRRVSDTAVLDAHVSDDEAQ